MGRRILITGGAGFIGSHLAKKLAKTNNEVVIIDRLNSKNKKLKNDRLHTFLNPAKYTFYDIELENLSGVKKIFKNHKFDCICHLAAETSLEFNSELYKKRNILGTITIFELAKIFEVPKIVFASSSMVYGNNTKLPFTEDQNTDHPLSLYAATKKYDEVMAYTYHHLYGIKMIGLRFFTTFGSWGSPEISITSFAEKILKGEKIIVHNQGKTKRDFNYIDNTISGIMLALEANLDYELINLGSGTSTELNQVIKLIEEYTGKEAKKEFIPMQPGDLPETRANIDKAKKLLSYKPKINIEEGIKKYIEWLKEYRK